jgi:hypothetical protein
MVTLAKMNNLRMASPPLGKKVHFIRPSNLKAPLSYFWYFITNLSLKDFQTESIV